METKDLLSRIDCTVLYPPFYNKYFQMVNALNAQGLEYFAICGFRSFEQQDALFAKGRTVPGGKVTNAKGGYSAHQYWCATDSCRDSDVNTGGLQPDWNRADYLPMADMARKFDLEPGFYWTSLGDAPHVQLPLRSKGVTMEMLRTQHSKGGRDAVFAFLNKYSW